MAISMIGANDVGPGKKDGSENQLGESKWEKEKKEKIDSNWNLQVVDEGPILYIALTLLQIHYKSSRLDKNWILLDHVLMLPDYISHQYTSK